MEKKLGHIIYNDLTCKQCKPWKSFHKRFGLQLHNKKVHGRKFGNDDVFNDDDGKMKAHEEKKAT